jgi:hypothetical protein
MKRIFVLILAALAAAALFGGLVHAVLVAAHVSEPAATTVYGLTTRRLWATAVAVLALVGVVIGGLALARPASRLGTASGRSGAIVALVAGLIAVVNGVLNLAIATCWRSLKNAQMCTEVDRGLSPSAITAPQAVVVRSIVERDRVR